jgi:hypothetical protein
MKTNWFINLGVAGMLAFTVARAAEPAKAATPRVGVYDSRVVAFAHFWSDAAGKSRNQLIAQARAAKAAGDTARFSELDRALRELQARDHLEVFSTAPADEAMAALKDKLPEIQKELDVTRLVSKWDEPALKDIPEANRIDATDRLVRELLPVPTEKQQKTIAAMKPTQPLPLEQAKKLAQERKL